MEHELWCKLYALCRQLDKGFPRGFYRNAEIVAVWLWAVVHDRPVSWACDPRNWLPGPPFPRPSQSTMSRRLRSPPVRHLLKAMEQLLREAPTQAWVKSIDGKPLPVGGHSKDPEAHWGHAVRGFAKGYKFHAIWGEGPLPMAWELTPMNGAEPEVAQQLVQQLQGGGYLLGDKSYDSNPLYAEAAKRGYQLVAPRKRPHGGLGHRRHCPARLRAIELLQTPFGQALFAERQHIERRFGWLTSFFASVLAASILAASILAPSA